MTVGSIVNLNKRYLRTLMQYYIHCFMLIDSLLCYGRVGLKAKVYSKTIIETLNNVIKNTAIFPP